MQYNFVEEYKIGYMGRMETFSEDFREGVQRLNHICVERGIQQKFKHSNKYFNKSKRKTDFNTYYDSRTREIVYRFPEKDFEFFLGIRNKYKGAEIVKKPFNNLTISDRRKRNNNHKTMRALLSALLLSQTHSQPTF